MLEINLHLIIDKHGL